MEYLVEFSKPFGFANIFGGTTSNYSNELSDLPDHIFSLVIGYLPLCSIGSLQLVSRSLHAKVDSVCSLYIWQHHFHSYQPRGQQLDEKQPKIMCQYIANASRSFAAGNNRTFVANLQWYPKSLTPISAYPPTFMEVHQLMHIANDNCFAFLWKPSFTRLGEFDSRMAEQFKQYCISFVDQHGKPHQKRKHQLSYMNIPCKYSREIVQALYPASLNNGVLLWSYAFGLESLYYVHDGSDFCATVPTAQYETKISSRIYKKHVEQMNFRKVCALQNIAFMCTDSGLAATRLRQGDPLHFISQEAISRKSIPVDLQTMSDTKFCAFNGIKESFIMDPWEMKNESFIEIPDFRMFDACQNLIVGLKFGPPGYHNYLAMYDIRDQLSQIYPVKDDRYMMLGNTSLHKVMFCDFGVVAACNNFRAVWDIRRLDQVLYFDNGENLCNQFLFPSTYQSPIELDSMGNLCCVMNDGPRNSRFCKW